jgi:RNA polymerase-binding transcription factor DksA
MNSDIIYYYDDGILYDKNKVKVMDYDLSIKKEENRKHFTNVDKAPDKEFKDAYSDRMTDATELEEAFNLEFDSYTVYGEKLTEAKENFCCICGEPIEGYGNNPEPFMSAMDGQCCDGCNLKFVIPARLAQMKEE